MQAPNTASLTARRPASILAGGSGTPRSARTPWRHGERIVLTPAGRSSLELELRRLRDELLPALAMQLAEARDDPGTHSDGTELLLVQQEVYRGERRASELEWLLASAREVTAPADGVIAMGSRVEIEDAGERDVFQVVDPREANVGQGRISIISPVGQALQGHSAGDQVVVEAPVGERCIRIVAVS